MPKKENQALWRKQFTRFISRISWTHILLGALVGFLIGVVFQSWINSEASQIAGAWQFVLGVLLGGIVGWVIPEFIAFLKLAWNTSHPLRRVLHPLNINKDPTNIFVASLFPKDIKGFEKSVPLELVKTMQVIPQHGMPWVLAENDARTLGYVMAILARAGKVENVTVLRDDIGMNITDINMVCIGSIKSNHKTNQINSSFKEVPLIFSWENDQLTICTKDKSQVWRVDDVYDYSILAKVQNEYERSKSVLLLGGISHTGTAGAGFYLWKYWRDIEPSLNDVFAYVIKVRKDNFQSVEAVYRAEFTTSVIA